MSEIALNTTESSEMSEGDCKANVSTSATAGGEDSFQSIDCCAEVSLFRSVCLSLYFEILNWRIIMRCIWSLRVVTDRCYRKTFQKIISVVKIHGT